MSAVCTLTSFMSRRKSQRQWYSKRHGLNLSADKFVQVPGVLSGNALLLRQFTNEGDGVNPQRITSFLTW
ncbi:hypothetical protein O9992_22760 [Vibrio lentus]|nr:hypothetical protein [Vibrio lentus]